MINSAVRGAVTVAALTTAFALLPASAAQADMGNAGDAEIEKVNLTGVKVSGALPEHVDVGDSWVTYLKLYTPKKYKYAGDASSRCSAVRVIGGEVIAQCTRVLRLKKGDLVLSDMIAHKRHQPVTAKTAILGGAGRYHSAYGEGTITLEGDRAHFALNVDE
jgi:hypothetical protein